MKVVILAGGFGTRLSEVTDMRPKPMVEIGGKPILWHIMKIYSHYGFNDFVICCGYKGYFIKDYFHHYYMHQTDITINLQDNSIEYHNSKAEPWKVTMIDTGLNTMTGGRISRIRPYVGDEPFLLTYGDGVADVNIADLVAYHKAKGCHATVTAVQPSGRFGGMSFSSDAGDIVTDFKEKPKGDGGWINGGFFVLNSSIFDYIKEGDSTIWEQAPLENLARDAQLAAFRHQGFWKPMDTLRDKNDLENMWERNSAPWKVWK